MNLPVMLAALAAPTPVANSTRSLFSELGYPTDRQQALDMPTWTEFEATYVLDRELGAGFDRDRARVSEWAEVDLAFQLAQADLTDALTQDRRQLGLVFEEARQVDVREVQAWLVFSLRLTGSSYSRAELAALTREVNRLFRGPALVLLTYGPGKAALAVIHRRVNKQDGSRDVLEKVTLLKDIDLAKPNRAHLEILADLSLARLRGQHPAMHTFAELYRAWQQTLDTQLLNNRFYRELRNWYFWAVEAVEFPADGEPDRGTRNATGVIRLITRLIFCWFLKEKGLIPADVFDEKVFKALVDAGQDATGSAYYRAILQNLFFATLNTEMEKDYQAPADQPGSKSRLFKPATKRGIDPNRGEKTYYRYANLFRDEAAGVKLFQDIPYLNGGLFECLDERSGEAGAKNSINKAVDCFTTDKGHHSKLQVPDALFFQSEHKEDLSGNYDEKEKTKHQRDEVRGLIPLLNRYKFTVEENTPLEEEVALDPELLGRVFESLLATYNPETRQTARKQTGSFYTPREIVGYMVDESLLRYLADKLAPASNGRAATTSKGAMLVQAQDRLAENLFGETKPQQASLSLVPVVAPVADATIETVDAPLSTTDGRLRYLLGHEPLVAAPHPDQAAGSDSEPLFSAEETRSLVKALAQARILDPACGSGAYPMGTLQQLTNVLSRLDPHNHYWREALAEQVQLQVRGTFRIEDAKQRQRLLSDINEVFEQHTGTDYGRKLYLIQQALYGVDLQPIAVQITKLRFFISLVVEQLPNDTLRNRGIRALPNLETKFVAANSLVRLARPTQLVIQNPAIDTLKGQLLEIRRQHFLARRDQKRELRVTDKRLRGEISVLLKKDGWNPTEANQVAAWNPYDQNAHADFFDPEWMFGIGPDQGFDVVIGNPPYVQLQKIKDVSKQLATQGYTTFVATGDLYVLFYERGVSLLRPGGLLCYITSNKWMRAGYGNLLREFLARKTNLLALVDFSGIQVFDSATVDTNILLTQRAANQNQARACVVGKDFLSLNNLSLYFQQRAQPAHFAPDGQSWVVLNGIEGRIKAKIEAAGTPLKEWDVQINYGIKTGYNEAFIIDESTKDKLLKESPKSVEIIRPILRGRDIKQFNPEFANLWLLNTHNGLSYRGIKPVDVQVEHPEIYKHLTAYQSVLETRGDKGKHWSNLRNCAYLDEFDKEKIMWIELTDQPKFALDTSGYFVNNTVFFMTGQSLAYLTGFLNSALCEWQLSKIAATSGVGTSRWFKVYVEQIRVPKINLNSQEPIASMVKEIILATTSEARRNELKELIDHHIFKLFDLKSDEIEFINSKRSSL